MSSEPPSAHPHALQTLLSRQSVPAIQLHEPAPSDAEIAAALDVALRAPDHGALRPWRFVLVRGAARERLCVLLERRMRERDAQIAPGKIDKALARVRAAPLVIAVGARIQPEHKVPELEQLLSAGAAVMNLLNGFHTQGYGAIWLTGDNAYDPHVAADLGFAADERSLGFVYIGSVDAQPPWPAARRAARETLVREWTGS